MVKLICTTLMVGMFVLSKNSFAEKPPQQMMQNLENLSAAVGGLTMCFKSSEYKKASTEEALRVQDVFYQADKIVENYEKYYRDDKLFLAYQVAVVKHSGDSSIRRQIVDKYGRVCSPKYIRDVGTYVADADSAVSKYFKVKK